MTIALIIAMNTIFGATAGFIIGVICGWDLKKKEASVE